MRHRLKIGPCPTPTPQELPRQAVEIACLGATERCLQGLPARGTTACWRRCRARRREPRAHQPQQERCRLRRRRQQLREIATTFELNHERASVMPLHASRCHSRYQRWQQQGGAADGLGQESLSWSGAPPRPPNDGIHTHSAARARSLNGKPSRCQTSTKASASASIKPLS